MAENTTEKEDVVFPRSRSLFPAAAVLLIGSACAQMPASSLPFQAGPRSAQPPPPSNPSPNRSPYPLGTQEQPQMTDPLAADKKFVKEAAEVSLAQIELGKLAQERGSSAAVKEFGKRMVDDHGRANEELKQAAAKANLDVPSEMSRKARKAHEKLSKMSGVEFDRAYVKITLNDHRGEVRAFDREARLGNVAEVKEFAAKALSIHQEHLKLAEQLESRRSERTGSQ